MNRSELEILAAEYISDLVDQLAHLQSINDEIGMTVVANEIKSLTAALDSEDAADNFFFAPYCGVN